MKGLILRNIKIYYRNTTMVFYSLLNVFIAIIVFSFTNSFGYYGKAQSLISNRWVLSGVLSLSAISTSLSIFSIMVRDRQNRKLDDFYTSPLTKKEVSLSFILSSMIISIIISLVQVIIFELVNYSSLGLFFNINNIINTIIAIILNCLFGSTLAYLFAVFFKDTSTYSSAYTLLSTLIGFINGVYINIGSVPTFIRKIIYLSPSFHGASLLRKAIFLPVMNSIDMLDIKDKIDLGISIPLGNKELSSIYSLFYIIITSIILYFLSTKILTKTVNE